MSANREKARLTIIQNLRQADATYPLNAAEIDLKRLQEAGSILVAVNEISQQSTNQKKNIDAQIQRLRNLTLATTDSATRLQAWLYSNRKDDQSHYDTLQT